jgi:phosphatidylserine/phosphatidylglycerophosphate/cardiolipin synthase-like enzyme
VLKISMFFSPVDPTQQIVLDHLAGATASVHLVFFNIRLQAVADELVAQHQAGRDVKILMDQKQMDKSYNTLDDWMAQQGLDLTGILNDSATDSTMHNKFSIVDGRRVLTGSMNYSTTAFNRSEEDLVLIDDADIAALYEEELLELLAGQSVPRQEAPGEPVQVYFGPEDRLDQMTIAAIDGAQFSVEVLMFSAGLDTLSDALVAAVNRGVNVVFAIDETQAGDTTLDETIEAGGAHVLRVPRSFPVELHNKLCVVDGGLVLVGSYNWTPLATFYNDENYLRIESAALATRAGNRITELIMQESTPFDPADFGWSAGDRPATFTVTNLQVRADAKVFISGDHANLGSLDASQAVEMTLSGDNWSATVDLPAGAEIDYQYLVRGPDQIPHRETGDLRTLVVGYTQGGKTIYDTFRE